MQNNISKSWFAYHVSDHNADGLITNVEAYADYSMLNTDVYAVGLPEGLVEVHVDVEYAPGKTLTGCETVQFEKGAGEWATHLRLGEIAETLSHNVAARARIAREDLAAATYAETVAIEDDLASLARRLRAILRDGGDAAAITGEVRTLDPAAEVLPADPHGFEHPHRVNVRGYELHLSFEAFGQGESRGWVWQLVEESELDAA